MEKDGQRGGRRAGGVVVLVLSRCILYAVWFVMREGERWEWTGGWFLFDLIVLWIRSWERGGKWNFLISLHLAPGCQNHIESGPVEMSARSPGFVVKYSYKRHVSSY
jgi:hypothetical protein